MIKFSEMFIAAGVVLAGLFWAMAPGSAQQVVGAGQRQPKVMKVDWNNLEIQTFFRELTTNPPRSLTPEDQVKLSKLKLPVIAFDRPPGVIDRAFGVERAPKRKRQLVTDPDDPTWYTIVDTYGDLAITVDGDLRIQQELPADTKIYTPPPGLAAEPSINVVDSEIEEGMEGLIAEYTVRKFPNIPYQVTIECAPAARQHCVDSLALQRDRKTLRIISARPPK